MRPPKEFKNADPFIQAPKTTTAPKKQRTLDRYFAARQSLPASNTEAREPQEAARAATAITVRKRKRSLPLEDGSGNKSCQQETNSFNHQTDGSLHSNKLSAIIPNSYATSMPDERHNSPAQTRQKQIVNRATNEWKSRLSKHPRSSLPSSVFRTTPICTGQSDRAEDDDPSNDIVEIGPLGLVELPSPERLRRAGEAKRAAHTLESQAT